MEQGKGDCPGRSSYKACGEEGPRARGRGVGLVWMRVKREVWLVLFWWQRRSWWTFSAVSHAMKR